MFNDKKVFLYYCTKTIDHLDIEIEDLSMLVPCGNSEWAVIMAMIATRERLIAKIQGVVDRVIDGEISACEEIEDILTKYTEYKPIKKSYKKYLVVDEEAFKLACSALGKDIKDKKVLSADEAKPLIEHYGNSWACIKELNSDLILDAVCNVNDIIDDLAVIFEKYKGGKELTQEEYDLLVRYLK